MVQNYIKSFVARKILLALFVIADSTIIICMCPRLALIDTPHLVQPSYFMKN